MDIFYRYPFYVGIVPAKLYFHHNESQVDNLIFDIDKIQKIL